MLHSSALGGCSLLRRGHARSGLPRANPAATERSTRSVVAILALPELAGRGTDGRGAQEGAGESLDVP